MIYPRLQFARARELFRISRNRNDPIIMNFPPRRLLEIERIDTLANVLTDRDWKYRAAHFGEPLVIRRQSCFQFSRYEGESIHPRPCLLGSRSRDGNVPCARRRYDTQ